MRRYYYSIVAMVDGGDVTDPNTKSVLAIFELPFTFERASLEKQRKVLDELVAEPNNVVFGPRTTFSIQRYKTEAEFLFYFNRVEYCRKNGEWEPPPHPTYQEWLDSLN